MKTNQFIKLILPSILSIMLSAVIGLAVVLTAIYSYKTGSGLLYNYLFGPHSSAALISTSSSTIDAFRNTIFGNSWLNKILYFGFWMLVGLITYLIIHYFLIGTEAAMEDIAETTYKNARLREMLTSLFSRMMIRISALIMWIIYSLFFIKTIVPFCVLQAKNNGNVFLSISAVEHQMLAFALLTIAIHMHVIFLRLVALKTRLFGEELEEA